MHSGDAFNVSTLLSQCERWGGAPFHLSGWEKKKKVSFCSSVNITLSASASGSLCCSAHARPSQRSLATLHSLTHSLKVLGYIRTGPAGMRLHHTGVHTGKVLLSGAWMVLG